MSTTAEDSAADVDGSRIVVTRESEFARWKARVDRELEDLEMSIDRLWAYVNTHTNFP